MRLVAGPTMKRRVVLQLCFTLANDQKQHSVLVDDLFRRVAVSIGTKRFASRCVQCCQRRVIPQRDKYRIVR